MQLVLSSIFSPFRYFCFETWKITLFLHEPWETVDFQPVLFALKGWYCFTACSLSYFVFCPKPHVNSGDSHSKNSSYVLFLLPWAHLKGWVTCQRAAASPHLWLCTVSNFAVPCLVSLGLGVCFTALRGWLKFFCWRKVCNCCKPWWLCIFMVVVHLPSFISLHRFPGSEHVWEIDHSGLPILLYLCPFCCHVLWACGDILAWEITASTLHESTVLQICF